MRLAAPVENKDLARINNVCRSPQRMLLSGGLIRLARSPACRAAFGVREADDFNGVVMEKAVNDADGIVDQLAHIVAA
jgi:hypothetical protein